MIILAELLNTYNRIAIAGGPKTGKSILVEGIEDCFHTDDTVNLPWEKQALVWVERTCDVKKFIIEGVQVVRALRHGMEVDVVIFLTVAHIPLTERQCALMKGLATMFANWKLEHPLIPVFDNLEF